MVVQEYENVQCFWTMTFKDKYQPKKKESQHQSQIQCITEGFYSSRKLKKQSDRGTDEQFFGGFFVCFFQVRLWNNYLELNGPC